MSARVKETLDRRANEVAGFRSDYVKQEPHYGSVDLALSREVSRLRCLAMKFAPPGD